MFFFTSIKYFSFLYLRVTILNSKEVIQRLKNAGWTEVKGRGKGSHTFLRGPNGGRTTVPRSKSLPIGTVKAIEKQTGVNLTK